MLHFSGVLLGVRAFSLYDVEQFIREAGAERVGEDAVVDLERELEKLTEVMTKKLRLYAEHAGRSKVIRKDDVLLLRRSRAYKRPANFIPNASSTKATSISDR